ncbi:MAG TPA: acyl-ACP thioesterase domain-containing protein [Thermoanaerobaculaceae bacterium]|nr:acyl-ACP thioesterase domain-containing protein [Thermoanaerobaculaceae bacterium]
MAERQVVWTDLFTVRAHEVGGHGGASAAAVCNWLQETAGNHATHLGWGIEGLMGQGMTWVLARLHLVLDRPPAWRERVSVTTWPAGARRLFAVREFRISAEGGAEFGRATTGWMVINAATRRPVRPPDDVERMGRLAPPRIVDDEFGRLPEVAAAEFERTVEVRFADLDMNGHANNVSVVAWSLEALPPEVALGAALREIEVEFRAEALHGDRIKVRAERESDGAAAFRHALMREADGREIARVRSAWAPAAR